jgi:hypothetical protein
MGFAFDLKCFIGTIVSVIKKEGIAQGSSETKKTNKKADPK